jgi:NDP-sugar pyrophosphorylase family protein
MQVMILAAGRSTRLGPIGLALPKPLVPICGYPVVTFGLALCRDAGLHDVLINLHHHGDRIEQVLGDGHRFGVTVRYSPEPDLLGTGGGIAHARRLFASEPVLVMNGKVVADIDLAAVIAAHRAATAGTIATLVVRDDPTSKDVAVDEAGRVVGLRGQGGAMAATGRVRMCQFTGIHVIEKAALDRLPAGVSDIVGDAYLPALAAGERISAFPLGGYFAEHSTPRRYLEGNLALLERPSLVPRAPGPVVGVDAGVAVHPTASVIMPSRVATGAVIEEGAVIGPGTVIGENSRVMAGVHLERTVVWAGAVAGRNCANAIITHDSAVVTVAD